MLKIKGSSNNQIDEKTNQTSSGVDEVEALKKKLYTDAVLGCQNRAKFEEDVKVLGKTFTYFTFDVNNLKLANDKFGHEAGDELLKVSADLGRQVFGNDYFYRCGGDEMAALIPNKELSVSECDEFVKKYKELLGVEDAKHDFPVAVSVGYASSKVSDVLDEVMKIADEMMYSDKKAYKEAHPEYDMRRARVTVDTIKQAVEDGTFHEYIEQQRREQGIEPKPKPVLEEVDEEEAIIIEDDTEPVKDIWANPGVDVDEEIGVIEDEAPRKKKQVPVQTVYDEPVNLAVGNEEEAYRQEEFSKKVQPILHETTKKVVSEAVKAQNDKMRLEVSEVLQDEVSYRLSKYEKRRKRRDLKEKIGFITKGVVIFLVILFIFGNQQLRTRIALVAKDAGDMLADLLQGKETSSNKLVHDLFKGLGSDINEVNTIDTTKDKGFDINSEEGGNNNE